MIKDIIVCVNEAEGRDNTIRAAARLANELNAGLTGLYVRVADTPPPGSLYGFVSNEMVAEAQKRENAYVLKVKENFQTIVAGLCCEAAWLEASSTQNPLKAIAYADLVIADQVAYEPHAGHSNVSFINRLILETGKPVVLIPLNWDGSTFGSNIVLGWDESREAGRALHDAMPFLQKAEHVEVACVNYQDEHAVVDISEISSYLTRRNVSNSFKLAVTDKEHNSAAKVLLHRAIKRSANLLVVGGYGHTRLRETILGGVSRYLGKHRDVPVLFSN